MSIAERSVPPLADGEELSREEFLRRWEAMPHLKRAELLGGVVHMPSPLSTPHGDILMNSNKLYCYAAPLDCLPQTARDAGVRWLLGEAYWLIDFRVADGPPPLDLDLPILGRRGGTHRVRRVGQEPLQPGPQG